MSHQIRPLLAAAAITATALAAPLAAELVVASPASASTLPAACEHRTHVSYSHDRDALRHGDDWAPHSRGRHGHGHGGTGGGTGGGSGSGEESSYALGHALHDTDERHERHERHRAEGKSECGAKHAAGRVSGFEAGWFRHETHKVEDRAKREQRHLRHELEHGRI